MRRYYAGLVSAVALLGSTHGVASGAGPTTPEASAARANVTAILTSAGLANNPDAPVGGLDHLTSSRFLKSSIQLVVLDYYPTFYVVNYDPVTRCALVREITGPSMAARKEFFSKRGVKGNQGSAPAVAANIRSDLITLSAGAYVDHSADCAAQIIHYYSATFPADQARLRAPTEFSRQILFGGTVTAQTAAPAAVAYTIAARSRVHDTIKTAQFLGSVTADGRTLVLLGDPFAGRRWIAEFRNMNNVSWSFLGASDAGIP